jgi:hypothetical protein
MLRAVLVDVGGTLWPNTWPRRPADDEERVMRLQQAVPGLTRREATGLVAALSTVEHRADQRQQTEAITAEAIRTVNPAAAVPALR